jgi:hypothetical protein
MGEKVKKIDVYCKNGHLLFGRYLKLKPGFLMKCYIERIGEDKIGVSGLSTGTDVFCPQCKLRIGRIKVIKGMPAVAINHGTVKRVKT